MPIVKIDMPIQAKNTKEIMESTVDSISKATSTDKANIHVFCTQYSNENMYNPSIVMNISWSFSPGRSPDAKKTIIREITDMISDLTGMDKANIVFLFHDLPYHDVGINGMQRTA